LVNVYLIGSTLIDAGIKASAKTILRQIGERSSTTHALTHAHPDHQGASAEICKRFNIPFWVGIKDAAAAESGSIAQTMPQPTHPITRFEQSIMAGPGHPVNRVLQEGDKVEDFVVIETPGHSPGHICFWREADGVLIAGDVLRNIDFLTTMPGLKEPPEIFTSDPVENRKSIQKIAALRPQVVCFGHGPVLRNQNQLSDFVNKR
jgi:glyoxylase-like metal-dependent hydrolase (beta-lactamase superfamily II)